MIRPASGFYRKVAEAQSRKEFAGIVLVVIFPNFAVKLPFMSYRIRLPLVLLLPFLSNLGSLAQENKTFTGPTMGTRYAISVVGHGAVQDTGALKRLVDSWLENFNRLMSTYDPDSELSRFNRHRENDWFAVSQETAEVVQYALQIARDTEGAFDPTVAPLVSLWGFGPEGRRIEPPTDEQNEVARRRVGFQHLSVRTQPPALRKAIPDLAVDLSALAPGFAADELSELLQAQGCRASLVDIGGEIVARGRKPNGSPWRIGVEAPSGNLSKRMIELQDTAVATSGDTRNAFVHGGVRYSHVIDPHTGKPVRHDLASVTVLADTCKRADALATALLVMGDKTGYAWCERHNVAALFMIRAMDGTITEHGTPAFERRSDAKIEP